MTVYKPVLEGFAGYERGGYEIQAGGLKTFPGADQLNFPGGLDSTGGSGGAGGSRSSGGRPEGLGEPGSQPSEFQDEFPSGQQDDLGEGESTGKRQRERGRFQSGNGNEGEDEGSLDDIPGVAGKDYPIYGDIPTTTFSCDQQTAPGYYADVEAQCQVFHICQKGGQKNSVLCPNGTIFNQNVFVCSWWYDFDCDSAPGLFALNDQVNAEGDAASTRGRGGGYSENSGEFADDGGPNSKRLGGYPENGQSSLENLSFDQGEREFFENGPLNDGQNAFGGYQENGPRPAKLSNFPRGGQKSNENIDLPSLGGAVAGELPNSSIRRGSGRFSEIGQNRGNNGIDFEGHSENRPDSGPQGRNRNDLTTSDGLSGSNGVDGSSSGYPSVRPGASSSTGQQSESLRGNARGRDSNLQGRGLGYSGQHGLDDGGQNGYQTGGAVEQSNQYLPPGEDVRGSQGLNKDPSLTEDRSYLPPS